MTDQKSASRAITDQKLEMDSFEFRADSFDQCYQLHMTIYAANVIMVLNMIHNFPADCLATTPIKSAMFGLLTLICCCAGYRHVVHSNRHSMVQGLHSAILPARFSSYALLGTFVTYGFCVVIAVLQYPIPSTSCSEDDIWQHVLPVWLASVGTMELLFGILCVTHGISIRRLIMRGGFIHFLFLIFHMATWGFTAVHTFSYALSCHALQHGSFWLGLYIGDTLLKIQQHYYDEAALLRRNKLLEQRVEQLAVEKQRSEYDRQLIQHELLQAMQKSTTGRPRSGACSDPRFSSSLHDSASQHTDSESESGTLSEPDMESEGAAAAAAALGRLQPGFQLPPEPSRLTSGAASSSGWSDVSHILRHTLQQQHREFAAQPGKLNPHAVSFPAPPQTASIAEVHPAPETARAPYERTKAFIRRTKRQRAAQRMLEAQTAGGLREDPAHANLQLDGIQEASAPPTPLAPPPPLPPQLIHAPLTVPMGMGMEVPPDLLMHPHPLMAMPMPLHTPIQMPLHVPMPVPHPIHQPVPVPMPNQPMQQLPSHTHLAPPPNDDNGVRPTESALRRQRRSAAEKARHSSEIENSRSADLAAALQRIEKLEAKLHDPE